MVGRPINQDREIAIINGDKTYLGGTHGCGNNVRYVKGGGCVHCARQTAFAQREALKEKIATESLDKAARPQYAQPWD